MAGNITNKYGTNNQSITITLASLGSGNARASTAIDNTSNNFIDALVQLSIKTGTVAAPKIINVYAFGTTDGGTTYPEGATGTDGAVTLTSPPNVRLIGVINVPSNATTFKSNPMSVAAAFGGVLPDHWGIIVENQSGVALDGTEGNHNKTYQGVYAQYT